MHSHVKCSMIVCLFVCLFGDVMCVFHSLAGVNLSLLSKVMSSKLSRGTYNGGLLSTEAGTLARVVSDCTITLAGYLGTGNLLNATLAPTLLIGILGVVGTLYTYDSMF